MLELAVLAAPVALFVVMVILGRAGVRAERRRFAAGMASRGWTWSGDELRFSVPLSSRELRIEPFHVTVGDSVEKHLGGRVVGLGHAPDAFVCDAESFALPEVPPGLVEVRTEPPFSAKYRAFAADPAAFERWCDSATRTALAHTGCVRRIEVARGSLVMRMPYERSLEKLDAAVAIASALADPPSRSGLAPYVAPTRSPRSETSALGCALALVLGLVVVPAATAFVPVTDWQAGRALAAPIVCPQGGVPSTLHDGDDENWNVRCKNTHGRHEQNPLAEGDLPSCRFPTLTTAVLSLEVYGALYLAVATVALRLASRRGQRA